MIRALVAGLLATLLVSGCTMPTRGDAVAYDQLPDVTLAGFDGAKDVDLGELTGPTVISLWASWCGACRQEMPILQEFHAAYGDRVALLGIDFQDGQTDAARALVDQTGVTYDLVSDEDGEINGQGAFPLIRALPVIAFVDADGTVTHMEAVVIDSLDELVAMVEEHLGVTL